MSIPTLKGRKLLAVRIDEHLQRLVGNSLVNGLQQRDSLIAWQYEFSPDVPYLVQLIYWYFTVTKDNATPGMLAVGLKPETDVDESEMTKYWPLLYIFTDWMTEKIPRLEMFREINLNRHTSSSDVAIQANEEAHERQAQTPLIFTTSSFWKKQTLRLLKWIKILMKISSFCNLINFLARGSYPTLLYRFANRQMVSHC